MTLFRHLRILFKKELLQLVKDKKMTVTIFGPPIWMTLLFGYAATMDLRDCTFAVLDRAHTEDSRALTAKLEHSQVFVRKADFMDEKDMMTRISDKSVRMGVVFPPDFTHNRQVEVITDGRNTSSAGMAAGYAGSLLGSRNFDIGLPKLRIRGWFNPDYDARWFTVPCLLANLLLITLTMLVALSLAREREAGTMDQLHLTPYTPFETLLTKGLSGLAVGIVQAVTTLLIILFWFQIPFTGSALGFTLLVLSFLMFSVGLGLLISVHSANLQQAMIITMIVAIPLQMLSGVTTPVACMPDFFRYFAMVNPMTYAVDALQRFFLEGAPFAVVLKPFMFIAGGGVICFFFAWNKFRKM